MDYEKAYKDALNRAKHALDCHNQGMVSTDVSLITSMFPELRESEDERIRKRLIEFFKDFGKTRSHCWSVSIPKILAWLEKQGESYTKRDVDNAYIEGMASAKRELEKQAEQKPTIEMKSAEESLGVDSDTYNEIVDECIYGGQKSQRMISAEAKEAMYDKPADTVKQKCEESKTKVFDAPTPFEDKLYAFVGACEFLAIPSKIEFILEHSQEILDAAREQIGKEQSSTWSKEDKLVVEDIEEAVINYWHGQSQEDLLDWLKSLKTRYTWKPSDEQIRPLEYTIDYFKKKKIDTAYLESLYNDLKKLREE